MQWRNILIYNSMAINYNSAANVRFTCWQRMITHRAQVLIIVKARLLLRKIAAWLYLRPILTRYYQKNNKNPRTFDTKGKQIKKNKIKT